MSKWGGCRQIVFWDMRENMDQGENFSNLQYFCQMIFGKYSIKMLPQFILIAQENYVLEIFFYVFAIDLLRKSIIQLAITQNIKFGTKLSCEFEITLTFEWNML